MEADKPGTTYILTPEKYRVFQNIGKRLFRPSDENFALIAGTLFLEHSSIVNLKMDTN